MNERCFRGAKGDCEANVSLPLLAARALLLACAAIALWPPCTLEAAKLDEMSLKRWAKLREVERYQLQIAEDYYVKKEWKVAAAEYEKYLTLYERSEGAPYAQLKWSLCHVKLRKANTAIKDGFQSLLDYWPDSPEAPTAAYLIGRTYKEMGQVVVAKKALERVLKDHPKQEIAVYALVDLVEIAAGRNDLDAQVALWKKLVFEAARTRQTRPHRQAAGARLAAHYFQAAAFDNGLAALAEVYPDQRELTERLAASLKDALRRLAAEADTRPKAERLLGPAVAYLRKAMPSDTTDQTQKALARAYWYHVADLHAAARADDRVPGVYDQIIKTFGADDEVLGRLGAWYESVERFAEAFQTYRRFRDKVAGLERMALSHRRRGQAEAAVAVYREMLGRDGDGKARWTEEIARTWYDARKYKEAIAVYQELLKLDPTNTPKWLWQIAGAYREGGRYKEAIGYYRQCTNFPSNYKEMAWCHRRLKQYREALTLYGQIVSDEPSAPWALLQIAFTYEEAGQKEAAIKAFRSVCRRYPKDSHASRAHAHLQSKYKISVTLGGAKDE